MAKKQKPKTKYEIVGSNGRKFPVNTLNEAKRLMEAATVPDDDGHVIVLRERAELYGPTETRLFPPLTLRLAPYMEQPEPRNRIPEAAYKRKANLPPALPFEEDLDNL